jgi:hypothetical protein
MKTKIAIIGLVVAAGVFMTFKMFSLAKVECSLCVTYKDQRQCSKALGPDDDAASHEALQNACALLVQGVTDTVACNRAPPENEVCRSR